MTTMISGVRAIIFTSGARRSERMLAKATAVAGSEIHGKCGSSRRQRDLLEAPAVVAAAASLAEVRRPWLAVNSPWYSRKVVRYARQRLPAPISVIANVA